MSLDWSKVRLTEHMTEAAVVEAECQVVFDFEGLEQTCYDVKVLRSLKGAGAAPFFAVGVNRSDPQAFRPVGDGDSAEEAVEACLAAAGVYHRRRVKQAGG